MMLAFQAVVVGSIPTARLPSKPVHSIDICQFYIVIVQDSLKTLVVSEFLFLDVNLGDLIEDKFQFYLASATK
jgi:hypothetical protein